MLIKVPVWLNLILLIYPSYGPLKSLKSPWIWFWQMGKNPEIDIYLLTGFVFVWQQKAASEHQRSDEGRSAPGAGRNAQNHRGRPKARHSGVYQLLPWACNVTSDVMHFFCETAIESVEVWKHRYIANLNDVIFQILNNGMMTQKCKYYSPLFTIW